MDCKKVKSGGYILYTLNGEKGVQPALCTTNGSNVITSKCTNEISAYYNWEFEKITNNTYCMINMYNNKWLYKKSNGRLGLTDDSSQRLIFTKVNSNYPSNWDGKYSGQTNTYKLNIIFNSQADYNSFASSAEAWNDISDKISVKAYPPNVTPTSGLNVFLSRKNLTTSGIEDVYYTTYGIFIPNSSLNNYLKTNNDIRKNLLEDWSSGVIFINQDNGSFNSLNFTRQKAVVMHEVGHALKLCHIDEKVAPRESAFTAMSIMRGQHSDINDTITLYDKLSLKKKWG